MAGWFEKLMARAKGPRAPRNEDLAVEVARPGPRESAAAAPPPPEGPVNAVTMFEILKLLAQIEYGIDVAQIATSLALSPEDAQANCEALEQEMFVHHHGDLGEWFIAQRGLEFLRLNGQVS